MTPRHLASLALTATLLLPACATPHWDARQPAVVWTTDECLVRAQGGCACWLGDYVTGALCPK
jgi:hypothetical protein